MTKNILEVPFWKIALRFSILFLGVISLIIALIHYMKYENFSAVSESLEAGTWSAFVSQKIAIAAVYGVSMTYFSRRKEKKKNKKY
tara:strand:+ start:756 stop:1013 length:258 start_codon:yes stop_codon:yes gene_type:complete